MSRAAAATWPGYIFLFFLLPLYSLNWNGFFFLIPLILTQSTSIAFWLVSGAVSSLWPGENGESVEEASDAPRRSLQDCRALTSCWIRSPVSPCCLRLHDVSCTFLTRALLSCLHPQPYEPPDDWSEHISSSGKKYYYNCKTEVSQWEKPKEWLERY